MEAGIPARLSPAEGRKFALTVGIAFLLFGGIATWREHPTIAAVMFAAGTVFVLAGLFVPSRLGPVQRGWMRMALMISRVTTPVFMGIVYFLVITPTGLLMSAFGRKPLAPPEAPDRGFWAVRRNEGGGRSDLQRQF